MGTIVVSFNPWVDGERNFFQFTGLTEEVLSALAEARAVIFPQTVSPELYYFVRRLGKPVFPQYDLRFTFPGKIGQILLFRALGLPHPRSLCIPRICAFGPHPGAAEIPLPEPPFVVKGNHGHEGREVFLVRNPEDWEEALARLRSWEASGRYGFLLQEYLEFPYDLRVVVLGKKRLPFWREGGFRRNLAQEGRPVPCPDPEIEARALEVVEALVEKTGFNLVAVDLLFREGIPLLNELNFVFGLRLLGGEAAFRHYLEEAVREFLTNL
ncbi:glutathione synthase [Thermosulfurimonas marina]|uniref:Glutathione synthase n=1 Tax=Thermosulfurimonas marina TaxID=2047767 RepID=A0A6H1WS53_9BACT|nr:glutathione synthase [Thermosulfurimonas marina]QJA06011.1 glutathione synthase [Thermosulfurimonas marina]